MGKNLNNKNRLFLICLILVLATFAVYYQVHNFKFVNYDDTGYVYKNFDIQDGITFKAVKWAFTTGHCANWHPLTWLSHMLDWQLFGDNAGSHHLVNLVFHIANTLLLFFVLYQMTGGLWQSAFVAALFALHPLHVESVAWVSERKDVLSTFFWFLVIWAYVRYVNQPKISRYLWIVVFFALGLISKPMLVTLPCVLLLLDYWPLERLAPKRKTAGKKYSLSYLIIEKIPLFAMVLASSIVTYLVQKKAGAVHTTEDVSVSVRLANASISYFKYIINMIWPTRLAVCYPHPGSNISIRYAVISAVFLLIVTILVLWFAKRRRYLFTGWFWYLGTLVPVIGFVQVGIQSMADRYTYITLTGLFIIAAWGLPELLAKWQYKKIVITSSAIAIISALSVCTYFQLHYWQDTITLFQHALEATKNNYTANICLAITFREQGKLDKAVYYCSEAVRIKPNVVPPHLEMGFVFRQAGRLDEAAEEYRKCLRIKPDNLSALNGMGITLGQQGKLDEAVKYLDKVLRIDPNSPEAHTNIGFALSCQDKLDEAAVHLAEAIRLDPYSSKAHYYLGQILVKKNKIDQAITHFEKALRYEPEGYEPMNDLAWYLAASQDSTIRNPERAVKLAQRACELTSYKNPNFLDTLSIAYAAAGDFGKAVETAQKALEFCQPIEQEQIKDRLILFKAGKPYVEPR